MFKTLQQYQVVKHPIYILKNQIEIRTMSMHDTCIKNSKSKCKAIFEISHTNPPTTPIQFHTWKVISNVG